jgi:predicted dehydrogenase
MAMGEHDCKRMIRACDNAGVKLMIAYRLHYEPANLRAIELVQKGKIGEPRFFDSTFSYQVEHGNIRTRASGGGALFDIGIYCVNAARYLFRDEPVELFAYGAGEGHDDRFRGVPSTFSVLLKFPNDRVAQFTCCFDAEATGDYCLVGTEGCIELENAYEYEGPRKLTLTRGGKSRSTRFKTVDQFGPELIEFSRCIVEDREPEPDGYEGLADIRILNAIQSSIRDGHPVQIAQVARTRRPDRDQEFKEPPVKPPRTVESQPPVGN